MFVQVVQGQVSDAERANALMFDVASGLAEHRPDILGRLLVGHDGGAWTMATCFTSEGDARAGEQKEAPPEVQERMAEIQSLAVEPPNFFDLRDPWLTGPA